MTFRTKALLVGAVLAVVLSTAITPVSANRLSLRTDWTTRGWRATWSASNLRIRALEATSSCSLTLEGSFHSGSFTKTISSLLGFVTDGRTEIGCTVLRETLPWHIQYQAFSGTLPNITRVTLRIIGAGLRVNMAGTLCLMRSTEAEPLTETLTRDAGGVITSAELTGTITTRFEDCFGVRMTIEGRSGSFGTPPPPPPPSTAITLSLI
jgi:hypothetical protein